MVRRGGDSGGGAGAESIGWRPRAVRSAARAWSMPARSVAFSVALRSLPLGVTAVTLRRGSSPRCRSWWPRRWERRVVAGLAGVVDQLGRGGALGVPPGERGRQGVFGWPAARLSGSCCAARAGQRLGARLPHRRGRAVRAVACDQGPAREVDEELAVLVDGGRCGHRLPPVEGQGVLGSHAASTAPHRS